MSRYSRRYRRGLVRVRARGRPVAVVSLTATSLLVQIEAELLELEVVLYEFLLLVVQLSELVLVGRDLLSHHAGRVATETLPLPGELATLLTVVVQKAAEVAQLLVVVAETLVSLLQCSYLVYLE